MARTKNEIQRNIYAINTLIDTTLETSESSSAKIQEINEQLANKDISESDRKNLNNELNSYIDIQNDANKRLKEYYDQIDNLNEELNNLSSASSISDEVNTVTEIKDTYPGENTDNKKVETKQDLSKVTPQNTLNYGDSFYDLIMKSLDYDDADSGDKISSPTDFSQPQNPVSTTSDDDASLKPEVNYTDPLVWHDPSEFGGSIATTYEPQNTSKMKDGEFGTEEIISKQRTDGVYYPLIKVNNRIIDPNDIVTMDINYDELIPTITLVILDETKKTKNKDIPHMNNMIDVIIVPPINGAYKGISLRFYSTDVYISENYVNLIGELDINAFHVKDRQGDITFDGTPVFTSSKLGCPGVINKITANGDVVTPHCCNQPPNEIPNFWEMMHVIAKECKLGFASTKNVKEINDRIPRHICYESWKDYINNQLKISGLDENSIFDCWVDLYGYLVIVNVSWILKENVTIEHLGIHAEEGIKDTSENLPETHYTKMVNRTFTNSKIVESDTNLSFDTYENITNNNFIREYGTTRTRYKMKIEGVSDGNNSLDTSQIQIIENSYDGKEIKDYEINDKPVIKIGVNDDYYDTIKQEDIRNSFFDKIRANILKLHLVRTNFGIQRGTLINLVFFTNQADLKHTILTSSSNIAGENKETNFDKLTLGGMNKKDLIQDEGIELPIPSLSGLYYVDSMKFIYNKSKAEIDQYLYLIKKGPITNLVNKTTPTRLQNDFYPDAVTLPDTPDTTVEARSIVFN